MPTTENPRWRLQAATPVKERTMSVRTVDEMPRLARWWHRGRLAAKQCGVAECGAFSGLQSGVSLQAKPSRASNGPGPVQQGLAQPSISSMPPIWPLTLDLASSSSFLFSFFFYSVWPPSITFFFEFYILIHFLICYNFDLGWFIFICCCNCCDLDWFVWIILTIFFLG